MATNGNQGVSTVLTFNAQQTVESLNKVLEKLTQITGQIDKVIANTEKSTKSTKKATDQIDKTLKNLNFDSVVNNLTRAYQTMEKFTKGFVNYIEDLNLLKVAFGDTADEAKEMVENIADITGFDEATLVRMTATFRQLSSTLGLANTDADLLSTNLSKMALDIASLYNLDLDTAKYALQGALTAQPRSIKTHTGADVTQDTLQAELARLGIDRKVSSLNQAEKAIITYLSLERQLINSNGDLARTIDQPANMLKIFREQLNRAGRSIGNLFIPVIKAVIPYLTAFLMVFSEIVEVITSFLGIDTDSFWDSMTGSTASLDSIGTALDGITESSKKAQLGLRGFDKLNVIKTPTSGEDSSGLGLGIDSGLLGALDEYNLKLDSIRTKATEIRDRIMEWLGFTQKANGEWEFTGITFGTILVTLLGIAGLYAVLKKVFGVFSGISALFGGAKLATSVGGTAKSVGLLSKAFTGLSTALGVSTATLGGIIAVLALLGAGIAYLNFAPSIKSMDELSGASDKTKEALSEVNEQFKDLSKDLKSQDWGNQIVTNKDITKLKTKLNTLTSTIEDKLEEQKDSALEIYNETLEETIGTKALNEMRTKTISYYDEQKNIIDNYKNQILEIETRASNEHRALTEEEVEIINGLYDKMKTETVKSLSESESEAEWILFRMKENAKALTAEQASEIIKNSIKTRDETIANAKEQYEKTVFEAYKLKEAGAISEEEYQKIKDASATTRDEAIKNAKEQHQKVYDEFVKENEDIAKYIDKDTGGIKSKWSKLWSDLFDSSMTWKEKIKTIWNDLFNVDGQVKVQIKDSKGKTTNSILEAQIFGSKGGSFASGGFPETGQLFLAREAGPELVGSIGNKTAVANNDQIVNAVAQGVTNAILASGGFGRNKVVIEARGDSDGLMNFITFKQKEQDMQYGD